MQDTRQFRATRDDLAYAKAAATLAFSKALEAVEKTGVTPPEHQYLHRLNPVTMASDGRLVLAFGSRADAAAARTRPVVARLAHALRKHNLAAGIAFAIDSSFVRPRTVGQARNTLPAAPPAAQKVVYLPSPLACHTLPHSRTAGSEYTRVNGRASLTLLTPSVVGLPYGVYPRLLLIHFATGAVMTRRRRLGIGKSVNRLLAHMQIRDSGGPRGASTRAREQLRRLLSTTFVYRDPEARKGENTPFVDRWLQVTPDYLCLSLSEPFYRLSTEHAVPLDAALLKRFRRSPLSIDLYAWTTFPVTTVKRETVVPWAGLAGQLGCNYTRLQGFRAKVAQRIAELQRAWPELDVAVRERGLLVRPCAPSVLEWALRRGASAHR